MPRRPATPTELSQSTYSVAVPRMSDKHVVSRSHESATLLGGAGGGGGSLSGDQLAVEYRGMFENREDLAHTVAAFADSLTTTTRQLPEDATVLFFFSSSVPAVPLADYTMRLVKYMKASPAVFAVALHYLEKITNLHKMTVNRVLRAASADQPALMTRIEIPVITSLSAHRFLFAACVAAAKFVDDFFFDTAYYASVGGIQTLELARLEWAFFRLLDFNASCFPSDVQRVAGKMSGLRVGGVPRLLVQPRQAGEQHAAGDQSTTTKRRPSATTLLAESSAITLGAH